MIDTKQIGKNIRYYREKKDITLSALADEVDVAKSTIHRVEFGICENVSLSTVLRIAEVLEISMEQLFEHKLEEVEEEKTFKVPVMYSVWGLVEVEAKDEQDLMNKLKDRSFVNEMPLPDSPEYVEDSYEIDFESISDHNKE